MSMKLKALGLGLLAVLAMSALTVVNASAITPKNSHFVAEPPTHHLIIKGTETFPGEHNLTFQRTVNGQPSGEPIKCTHATYHGTLEGAAATTTQAVQVTPTYEECATANGVWGEVIVHHPSSCKTNVYEFTSGTPGTIHVNCEITITHPNCTIRIPKQTLSGAHYNTMLTNGVHALTLEIKVGGITGHFEGGLCVFLGTGQTFHMNGSATVWGEDTDANKVPITHTE